MHLNFFGSQQTRWRRHTILTVEHDSGNIVLWECFPTAGTVKLLLVDWMFDGARNGIFLKENMLVQQKDLRLEQRFTFLQEKDPKSQRFIGLVCASNPTERELFTKEWATV